MLSSLSVCLIVFWTQLIKLKQRVLECHAPPTLKTFSLDSVKTPILLKITIWLLTLPLSSDARFPAITVLLRKQCSVGNQRHRWPMGSSWFTWNKPLISSNNWPGCYRNAAATEGILLKKTRLCTKQQIWSMRRFALGWLLNQKRYPEIFFHIGGHKFF